MGGGRVGVGRREGRKVRRAPVHASAHRGRGLCTHCGADG